MSEGSVAALKIEQLRERARRFDIIGEDWIDLLHKAIALHASRANSGVFSPIECIEMLLNTGESEESEGER